MNGFKPKPHVTLILSYKHRFCVVGFKPKPHFEPILYYN